MQVVIEWNVTRTDSTFGILYYHIDGQTVKTIQFPLFWNHEEFGDCACCFADTPTQEHVETEF